MGGTVVYLSKMSISDNLLIIRKNIATAAKRANRDPGNIKIVAATKGVPANLIKEALNAGITDIGENRVQEAKSKYPDIRDQKVTWHMIGHLQTNKVKEAVKMFSVVQSVDSEKLAREISRSATGRIEVFLEVNTSGEASKYGVAPEEAVRLTRFICGQPNLILSGLMTIGPLTSDETATRKSFRALKGLFEQIKQLNLPGSELKYLSMGMSGDYPIAIEEGSNMVRIGTAIFGIKHKKQ